MNYKIYTVARVRDLIEDRIQDIVESLEDVDVESSEDTESRRKRYRDFAKYKAYERVMKILGTIDGDEVEEHDEVYIWVDSIETLMVQWARSVTEGFKIIGTIIESVEDDRLSHLLGTRLLDDVREIHARVHNTRDWPFEIYIHPNVTHLSLENMSRRVHIDPRGSRLRYLSIIANEDELERIQEDDPYYTRRYRFNHAFQLLDFLRLPCTTYHPSLNAFGLLHLDLSQYKYSPLPRVWSRRYTGDWMYRHKSLVSFKSGPTTQSTSASARLQLTRLIEFETVRAESTMTLRVPLTMPNVRYLGFHIWQAPRDGDSIPWGRTAPYKNLMSLRLTSQTPIADIYKNIDFSRFKILDELVITANNEILRILKEIPEGVVVNIKGLSIEDYVNNVDMFEGPPERYAYELADATKDLTHLLNDERLLEHSDAFRAVRNRVMKWIRENIEEEEE